jgi:LemA protein
MNKKVLITIGVIVGILLVGWGIYTIMEISTHDKAVALKEGSKTKWANVESSYQRRSDLIPNLVNTVKGAADFEKSTLTDVIEARAKATSVNVDASKLDAGSIQKYQKAQGKLSSSLSRLLVSVERYPKLTATENFQNLQSQLEGTENRINVARNRFNESVRKYNTYVQTFPFTTFGDRTEFEKLTAFEAEEGSEKAPEVNF